VNIRPNVLWKVPIFCMAASWFTFNITAHMGGHFFTVVTVGSDGIPVYSADPVRSAVFRGILFLAVLFIGGLWAFRAMTRKEIAFSAAIASALYLGIVLAQLYLPGFSVSLSVILAYVQDWTATLSSFLIMLTDNFTLSVITAAFAPMLFIPFGNRNI